jgi:hypothetical protein
MGKRRTKRKQKKHVSFSILPVEIIEEIFTFIAVQDQYYSTAFVNKHFYNVFKKQDFQWRNLYHKYFIQDVADVSHLLLAPTAIINWHHAYIEQCKIWNVIRHVVWFRDEMLQYQKKLQTSNRLVKQAFAFNLFTLKNNSYIRECGHCIGRVLSEIHPTDLQDGQNFIEKDPCFVNLSEGNAEYTVQSKKSYNLKNDIGPHFYEINHLLKTLKYTDYDEAKKLNLPKEEIHEFIRRRNKTNEYYVRNLNRTFPEMEIEEAIEFLKSKTRTRKEARPMIESFLDFHPRFFVSTIKGQRSTNELFVIGQNVIACFCFTPFYKARNS